MRQVINLLIIEDDMTQTFLIKETLSEELYKITNIQDGREALNFLLTTNDYPDLILMDYHLPSVDGLTIMNKLKENGRNFDIIFLTADYSIETAIKSINSGALEFIPKDGRFVNNIPNIVNKAYQSIISRLEKEEFEKAYKESESRFKMVMEASKEGIFEWNRNEVVAHVSPNNAHMLGYDTDEFPVNHDGFFNLVHPDDREMLMNRLMEHSRLNTSFYEAEIRVRAKDGNYKWLLQRGIVAEKDKEGNPIRIIGTHADISERKLAEEMIIETNRRLTTLIGNLPGIVYRYVVEDGFQLEFIGERVTDILGYSSIEILQRKSFPIHLDDKQKVEDQLQKAIESKNEYELYYRVITNLGEVRWVLDHGKSIYSANGQLSSLEGYITDITEKKVGEEALKQSEEEKNIILDNSLQAFILLRPNGQIVAFNKVANHKSIITAGKVLKKDMSVFDFMPNPENTRMHLFFNKVLNGEPAYWEQFFSLRGNISWFENVLVPIFASREEIKFLSFTSTDITERKIAEEKIINSENLYNTTINSLNDMLFVVDEKLTFILANDAVTRFIANSGIETSIIGRNISQVFSFINPNHIELYSLVFTNFKEQIFEETINLGNKSMIIEVKIAPIFQQSKAVRAVSVIRDITDRKNFEKRIMNAIIETEERERKRFSEDLHDEMGSILSTIKIYINTIHREEIAQERKEELVAITNQLINQAIENSKEIANNLSPNIIKRFGLIKAIDSFCEKIQSNSGISFMFDKGLYFHKLHEDQEISIYRIIIELINNTLKHSGASAVSIVFFSTDEILNISYKDDGKGFDFEKKLQKNSKGLGLQNILSRISSLNGSYKIDTAVSKGFTIQLELGIRANGEL